MQRARKPASRPAALPGRAPHSKGDPDAAPVVRPPSARPAKDKQPFDIDAMMTCLRAAVADQPKAVLFELADLTPEKIDDLIRACTFHEPKSRTIHAIAKRVTEEFEGRLPCGFEALTDFAGVGPKCANLVLGIACDEPGGIPVDIHVHRVTNRWGYVAAATPEKSMAALEAVLPRRYWVEINKLMVPFGKSVCTGKLPKCSTCPLLEFCRQVGVTAHR